MPIDLMARRSLEYIASKKASAMNRTEFEADLRRDGCEIHEDEIKPKRASHTSAVQ